jgi:hypothetical protein
VGRAHVLVPDELLKRIKIDPRIYQQLLIVTSKPFGEDAHLLLVSSDRLPEGYHGQHDLILDGGQIRFKKDADV